MQSSRAPWTLQPWQTSLNPITSASISTNGRISPPTLRNFSTTLPAVAVANLRRYARPCCEDAHSCCAPTSLVGASLACIRRPRGRQITKFALRSGVFQVMTSPAGSCTGSSSTECGGIDHLNSKWRPASCRELGHYLRSMLTSCKGYARPPPRMPRRGRRWSFLRRNNRLRSSRTSPIDS